LFGGSQVAASPSPFDSFGGQLRGAGLPRVAEGHHVVDLYVRARGFATEEGDSSSGVGIVESAGDDEATVRPRPDRDGREVPAQDVVAGVAAVVTAGD
jgi:hypothetical protein